MTLADDASTQPRPPVPGPLGRLASRVYSVAINRINRRFDRGVGVVTFDRPVVSVGNLSTGGTGKTPMVVHVVNVLRAAGRTPCIAMRGYGSADGSRSDEAMEYAKVFGDIEAANACGVPTGGVGGTRGSVPVVAQANRVAGLIDLFASEGGEDVDSIVLDDGFQHRKIARDLNIVLIDATRSPFHDSLLPAGHLREPVGSLSRADALVITHAECSHADDVATLRVRIHECQPRAHIAVARHAWSGLVEVGPAGERARPPECLDGKRVAAVAAIGNPAAFFDLAKFHTKRDLVLKLALRDHDPYDDATVVRVLDQLRDTRPDVVLVTEKDWSKLERVESERWPCPVLRPRLELVFDSGGADLDAMIVGACRPNRDGEEVGTS